MKKRKHLFHTVIISFLFKFIAIHKLSNLKCLLLPTLSQRRSMKNLIPGVIGGIFNDIWVPESLWGQRRLEKSPMLWNPVLHFLNLIIGETVIKPGLVKVFALLAIKTDELSNDFIFLSIKDKCPNQNLVAHHQFLENLPGKAFETHWQFTGILIIYNGRHAKSKYLNIAT